MLAGRCFANMTQPISAPATQPLPHLPNLQTISMKMPRAETTKWRIKLWLLSMDLKHYQNVWAIQMGWHSQDSGNASNHAH